MKKTHGWCRLASRIQPRHGDEPCDRHDIDDDQRDERRAQPTKHDANDACRCGVGHRSGVRLGHVQAPFAWDEATF